MSDTIVRVTIAAVLPLMLIDVYLLSIFIVVEQHV